VIIRNISLNFINLYGLITDDINPVSAPDKGTYDETGISADATINLLDFNTPGRIFESFEPWRQIISENIVVICDAVELNPADSLEAFKTQNFQCLLDNAVLPPAPVPDPLCLGNVKFDPTKWISAAINADINDFDDLALSDAIGIKFTSDSNFNDLTGVEAQNDGKILIIGNEGSLRRFNIPSNDVGSVAANRFLLSTAQIEIRPNEFIWFFYDGTVSRWRSISGN
jgi:hypothetical protein